MTDSNRGENSGDLNILRYQMIAMGQAGEMPGGCDATMQNNFRENLNSMTPDQLASFASAVSSLHQSGVLPATSGFDGCNSGSRSSNRVQGR